MVVSPLELGVIAAALLLFWGYRRLPRAGRSIGEAVAELRHADERHPEEDHQ